MKKLDLSMLPIEFKIGDEYKEGDILKSREGIYWLVCKASNKELLKCCNWCWLYNAPLDVCVPAKCTSSNLYFRPFETYQEEEEYNVGDLLKIPKFGEPGKFILSMVVEDDVVDEFNNGSCEQCTFSDWIHPTYDCCSRNKCVDCLRDTNGDDIYYKPLAEVSE